MIYVINSKKDINVCFYRLLDLNTYIHIISSLHKILYLFYNTICTLYKSDKINIEIEGIQSLDKIFLKFWGFLL